MMTIIFLTRNPTRNKTFFDLQGIFLNLSFNKASNGQTKSYRSLPSLCLRGSSRQLIFHIEKFIISCQVVSLNHSPYYWHPFHTLKQGKSSYSSSFSTSSFCKAASINGCTVYPHLHYPHLLYFHCLMAPQLPNPSHCPYIMLKQKIVKREQWGS